MQILDTYKGEKILICMSVRIHPADKNIPDCRCILALSERHLFIIEDNYDGTYTDHYYINVRQIEDVRISVPDNTEKTHDVYFLGRLFKVNKPDKFLEIIYKDAYFEKQHLFFDECDDSPKKFVKAFKKVNI
jgi:hypothetical protein